METRNAKLIVNKSGGTASNGAKTFRITLPNNWIEEMGLSENNRGVYLKFDGEKITISKKSDVKDFIIKRKANKLIKLEYFYFNDLCTTIIADYSEKEIAIENHKDNNLYLAFGNNKNPNWNDYLSFLESRCISKNRDRLKDYLEALGLDSYEPLEIIKKTQGRMAEDNQFLMVTEL